MSGYLSHLVGRTLGGAATLMPAGGNPFEPAALAEPAQGAIESVEIPERHDTRRQVAPLQPPALAKSQAPRPREQAIEAPVVLLDAVLSQAPQLPESQPESQPESPLAQPDAMPPLAHSPRVAPASRIQTTELRSDEGDVTAGRAESRAGLIPSAPTPGTSLLPRTVPDEPRRSSSAPQLNAPTPPRSSRRAAKLRPLAAAAAKLPGAITDAAFRGEAPEPDEIAAADIRAESPAVRRAAPLSPLLRAMPPPAGSDAAASAAPDVHITIGRVEIRAQTAPPRTRPQGSNAPRALRPSLGLADYLTRRGGKP